MTTTRKIRKAWKSKSTIEGAGVHLRRALGFSEVPLFDDGDRIMVSTETEKLRFLLVAGKPIGEPIAWHGPIVMNTQAELRLAFDELNHGNFIKHKQG